MSKLTEIYTYDDVMRRFSWDSLWELFDGDRERMNLAHECIDRHRDKGTAVSIMFADGHREHYDYAVLADLSSRFANWLTTRGIVKGDRVAIVLDPGKAFYVGLFGTIKRGAIAVPLFTLFGPEGLALRINDCQPRLILTQQRAEVLSAQFPGITVVEANNAFWSALHAASPTYRPDTSAADVAVFQYTSGTTRALPEAVKHTHRSVVTLMIAALYGVGLRPCDRYFCPSSPAWGHGLWHGTVAPLALGIQIASYSGKFEAVRMFEALEEFQITNMAAAPTVFRLLKHSGLHDRYRLHLEKISYTGEPMDPDTFAYVERAFGVTPCSMYGTTEVGVLIVNFPGLQGYTVKPDALGKAAPGWEVAIVDRAGQVLPPHQRGDIAVKRKGQWFYVKDRGYCDEAGYFYHEGRSDDVIISAGWTMSAVEIEQTLLKHPAVVEAAVIGVPDPLRGQIAKAYIVTRDPTAETLAHIQAFMKAQLSQHEYPRQIEFLDDLPKTPAGKINRNALRDRGYSPSPAGRERVG
jgi:acetyl-CoA synthetase